MAIDKPVKTKSRNHGEADKSAPFLQAEKDIQHAPQNFHLESEATAITADNFELEAAPPEDLDSPQVALHLPQGNSEQPEPSPQIDFDGMQPRQFSIKLETQSDKQLHFKHARSLLESLEAQDINIPYQCRDGYCGSCRTTLLDGEVTYTQEPLAWLNDGEILPCCCIPKTDIHLKLKG